MGLQSLYHGKFDPKREVHTLKETMTLTDYKVCLYIHICIYRHLYRSLLLQSSGIQAHSTGFQWNGCIPAGIHGASKSTEQQCLRKKDDEYITSYNIFQAHIIVSYDSSHLHGFQDWLSSSQKYTSTGMKNMAGTLTNIESENLQESYRNMWGTNNQFGVIWLQTLVMIQ